MASKGMRRLLWALAATMIGPVAAQEAEETVFDVSSVTGAYVMTLSGYILTSPATPPQYIPLSGLGRICVDGQGNAEVKVTQNVGGVCVYDESGTATYTVDPDGTGTVTANVTITEVGPGCEQLEPPVVQGTPTAFEAGHAIDANGNLKILVRGLQIPTGPDASIGLPIVMEGEALKQGPCTLQTQPEPEP